MALDVFVSSTYADLIEHRRAVIDTCLKAGFNPIAMEFFSADPRNATEACLDKIENSDVFIGIYAHRYGFVPKGSGHSITEIEFDYALQLKRPCLCFVVDESFPWDDDLREPKALPKLRALKAKIDQTVIRESFTTPEDLALKVAHSLSRLSGEAASQQPKSSGGDVNISFGNNTSFKDSTFIGRDYHGNIPKKGGDHDTK